MSSDQRKGRLDQILVERGLAVTRARARDLILRGEVLVAGRVAIKPASPTDARVAITLRSGAADYVSRGALKLQAALAHFAFDAGGRIGLDIGASAGGFTETLLAAGASKVYAVDNGRDQLHPRLATDPRVVSLESTDARRLDQLLVPEPVGALVADVSFISLTKALPAALRLAAPGCWLLALIKPQFEAAPGLVPRNGIIRNEAVRDAAIGSVVAWLTAEPGWRVLGTIPSPIRGGDGNAEALIGAVHDER